MTQRPYSPGFARRAWRLLWLAIASMGAGAGACVSIGAALVALSAPEQAHAQVLRCTDARTGAVSYTDGTCRAGSKVQEVEPRRSSEDIERDRAQAAEALARKQQRLQNDLAAARLEADRDAQRAQQQQQQNQQQAQQQRADPAGSPECTRARRQFEAVSVRPGSGADDPRLQAAQQQMELVCLGAARYAELQRDRAARQPGVVVVPQTYPAYPGYSSYPTYPGYPGHPVRPPHIRPPHPAPPPPPRFTQCNVFRCYDAQGRSYSRP